MNRSGVAGIAAAALLAAFVLVPVRGSPGRPQDATRVMPAACPASAHRVPVGSADTQGLRDELAPDDPTEALLCRYHPHLGDTDPRAPHGALYATRRVDQTVADRLADELNAIPVVKDKGRHSCPPENITNELLFFGYPKRPPVTVRYHSSGCSIVTNGVRTTGRFTDELHAFVSSFDALVPRRAQPGS